MGFSVSGAAAILLLASFIVFSIGFTAAANGLQTVSDAQEANARQDVAQANTAIAIEDVTATPDGAGEIQVANTGTQELSVEAVTVFVAGEVVPPTAVTTTVNGVSDTDVWAPGDTLTLQLSAGTVSDGDRVVVVTEHGIAASTTVALAGA